MMKQLVLLFLLICFQTNLPAMPDLSGIFTSHMVLQRDQPVRVWGHADPKEPVIVNFNGQKVTTKADKNGGWEVTLQPMKFGGPFTMMITDRTGSTELKNILIGDVFLCSGQSNMEWLVKNSNDAVNEINNGSFPSIRLFTVNRNIANKPRKDLSNVVSEQWQECRPETVADFSAVAYFFGRKIHREIGVPIGLINSSWGGTDIQTWISWDIMSTRPEYKMMTPANIEKELAITKVKLAQFDSALRREQGVAEKWFGPDHALNNWETAKMPAIWESTAIGKAIGVVWFRKEINITSLDNKKTYTLNLGPIDDDDVTYVNGHLVGKTQGYDAVRSYKLDPGMLKNGINTIVVKMMNKEGRGGFYGKEEQLYLETGDSRVPLTGEWNYRVEASSVQFGIRELGPNSFPCQLYNGMIAPLTKFAIKGAIWYQGENNAWEAFSYRTLFSDLIKDWRNKWGYSFPFLWVQLANFKKPVSIPAPSDWAELREAQTMALSLPATAQAVTIDIGEAEDIHPRNKQEVGNRLGLAALKLIYDQQIVQTGPTLDFFNAVNEKIILKFKNTGTGLVTNDRYGYVRGFTIAGADQQFVWAKACIAGDSVIVWSSAVPHPVAVRYAWADNPDDASLYNAEGLPACPFRTDQWKAVTDQSRNQP